MSDLIAILLIIFEAEAILLLFWMSTDVIDYSYIAEFFDWIKEKYRNRKGRNN